MFTRATPPLLDRRKIDYGKGVHIKGKFYKKRILTYTNTAASNSM
jgi:hypothetical protein